MNIAAMSDLRRPMPRVFNPSHLAGWLVCCLLLLAPALWNRYPLLQFDTGGYLVRWYEGYLVPSRSTAFGLFLHVGEGLHFWPELVLQTVSAIWIISLILRVMGLGARTWQSVVTVVGLSLVTALPFLASTLLTDIFAGLSVLAIYLLIFNRLDLRRIERIVLFLLVAFAAATHSGTLAVLLAVLVFAIPVSLLSGHRLLPALLPAGGAIAGGAVLLVATNFAFSGQLVWTPGGFGIGTLAPVGGSAGQRAWRPSQHLRDLLSWSRLKDDGLFQNRCRRARHKLQPSAFAFRVRQHLFYHAQDRDCGGERRDPNDACPVPIVRPRQRPTRECIGQDGNRHGRGKSTQCVEATGKPFSHEQREHKEHRSECDWNVNPIDHVEVDLTPLLSGVLHGRHFRRNELLDDSIRVPHSIMHSVAGRDLAELARGCGNGGLDLLYRIFLQTVQNDEAHFLA